LQATNRLSALEPVARWRGGCRWRRCGGGGGSPSAHPRSFYRKV